MQSEVHVGGNGDVEAVLFDAFHCHGGNPSYSYVRQNRTETYVIYDYNHILKNERT